MSSLGSTEALVAILNTPEHTEMISTFSEGGSIHLMASILLHVFKFRDSQTLLNHIKLLERLIS